MIGPDLFVIQAPESIVYINGKVSLHKWQSIFTSLAIYVKILSALCSDTLKALTWRGGAYLQFKPMYLVFEFIHFVYYAGFACPSRTVKTNVRQTTRGCLSTPGIVKIG